MQAFWNSEISKECYHVAKLCDVSSQPGSHIGSLEQEWENLERDSCILLEALDIRLSLPIKNSLLKCKHLRNLRTIQYRPILRLEGYQQP